LFSALAFGVLTFSALNFRTRGFRVTALWLLTISAAFRTGTPCTDYF